MKVKMDMPKIKVNMPAIVVPILYLSRLAKMLGMVRLQIALLGVVYRMMPDIINQIRKQQ